MYRRSTLRDRYYQEKLDKLTEQYKDKKVVIPFLEVWTGQSCTLKCRYCCHLIPYVTQRLYDMKELCRDLDHILELCEVPFFSVVGGEPFCNSDIGILFDFLYAHDEIFEAKIVTNGTVSLSEEILDKLSKIGGKIEVHVNTYPGRDEQTYEFFKKLQIHGIPSKLSSYKAWKWKKMGNPGLEPLEWNKAKMMYNKCWIKECNTLADGYLTVCPRGITSEEVFGVPRNPYEYVKISEIGYDARAKAQIALCISPDDAKEYCRFCRGMTDDNIMEVIPGEQV